MSAVSSDAEHAPEPRHAERAYAAVPWGAWIAVIYAIVVFFAAQIAAGFVVALYPHLRGWGPVHGSAWLNSSVIAQFWFVLLAEVLTFGAIWWFVRRRGSNLRAIGWREVRAWDIVRALSGFAVYFVGYAVLLTIATHLFPSLNVDQKQDLGFSDVSGNTSLILTFLSLVVLPPVVEETVFRGFLFTGIRNRLKPVAAALITSLLFAVPHLLESGQSGSLLWVAGIDTFTLSLVLCYLRHKTDSLWPGIFLHALKNGIAFVALYVVAR
jgi:membrane protease YdiL (CAAX protease family)